MIRNLERDIFPLIGDLPISHMTPPHVLEALSETEVRGAIETSKRVRQRISGALFML